MMTERLDATVVVALAVALLGVIPGAWVIASQQGGDLSVAQAPASSPPSDLTEAVTRTIATEPIVVAELDASVAEVLQEQGFLGRTNGDDAEVAMLDEAVVALLKDRAVVLRIAEEPAAP